jgi:MYXO-CTERM domain-containing protein
MRIGAALFGATGIVLALAGAAQADVTTVNGYFNNTRNFNDFPTSTLSSSSNFGAGTIDVTESNFGNHGTGTFANRHRYLFSSNGGASSYALANQDFFDLSFDIRVKATNMNLVEGGFYSDTFVGGEPRYIVKANDASFAFDAWLPFVFAGSYGNDVTTRLRMIYNPGSGSGGTQSVASTVQFFRDNVDLGTYNAGNFNSPDFINGYADGSIFGFYCTFSPKTDANGNALPDSAAEMHISNISLTPAPGAVGLLGLAGIIAGRRRR